MSNSREFCDYVLDQLSKLGDISYRSMFGGGGIYCNKIIFAIIIEDVLYFKVDEVNKPDYLALNSKAFTYKTKNDKIVSMSYFEVPIELLDDEDELMIWARKSIDSSIRANLKKCKKLDS